MSKKAIINNNCITCGLCEGICPEKAIELSKEGDKYEVIPVKCTYCEDCLNVCPVDAIETVEK